VGPKSKSILRVLAAVLLVCAIVPAALAACPLCKDAKSDSDYAGGSASLPSGFYYSIIFMVCAPFLVIGGLVTRIAMARKRRLSAPAAAGEASPAPHRSGKLAADSPGSAT
jgi:uncharacterized membrane protein